jgi:hypothetical protein
LHWKILDVGRVQQGIVEDHVRGRQRLEAPQREEVGTSRTGADKADKT